jgi:hypothetical protein
MLAKALHQFLGKLSVSTYLMRYLKATRMSCILICEKYSIKKKNPTNAYFWDNIAPTLAKQQFDGIASKVL